MNSDITQLDVNDRLEAIENNMVTRQELDQAVETVAVLANPDIVMQIESSHDDIRCGRCKEVRSVVEI